MCQVSLKYCEQETYPKFKIHLPLFACMPADWSNAPTLANGSVQCLGSPPAGEENIKSPYKLLQISEVPLSVQLP
jgi:hypothetical protein